MNNEYITTVPIGSYDFRYHMNREKTVETLRKMGIKRVMLAVESNATGGERREAALENLKVNTEYLHNEGFEVGAWFWTFLNTLQNDFVRMVSPEGKVSKETVCPTDESYCKEMGEFIKGCARTGVDLIQFDDDFRYGFLDMGFGCVCENHLKRIREILGEDAPKEDIIHGIMNGGKNKYRDAFIKANGVIFEEFAKKCRDALDEVNPDIRFGFCSCITSWDIDGTTPDRLAKILAGNTRPFYRLIGAPYWAAMGAWGHTRLSYVIEQERLEAYRREDPEIEIFSEGDTYPRPRYRVPAAYLEGFDTVLRADGCTDGILKYSFDYTADYDYETGYNDAHIRNLPAYAAIDDMFTGKKTVGVRVFDSMRKFPTLNMPSDEKYPIRAQELAFSVTARFLTANSLPTVFSGNEYSGAAFGEDARILTPELLDNGIILDYAAAVILKEKGIDTGLVSADGFAGMSNTEVFASGETIHTLTSTAVHKCTLADGAEVGSYLKCENEKVPVFYKYQNADGQKFAVFTFDGYTAEEYVFRSYERQKQVTEALEWLCGKKLPAVCKGHPDLYILTKEKGKTLSVGLWNFFPDKIYSAKVELPEEIASFKIFGADAKADGNILTVDKIEAYGFAAAEIEFKK